MGKVVLNRQNVGMRNKKVCLVSVSDPDSSSPDLDPEFKAEHRSGSGYYPDPGFSWQKIEKDLQLNKIWYFSIKNCNLLILNPP